MLAVVEPARVDEVRAICEKWQTGSAEIGTVTDSGAIRILRGGEVVGEMPVEALVDGCPLYDLEPAEPEGWIYGNRATLAAGATPEEELLALLGSPSIASKRWAFEQYDSMVGSRTVRRPEQADAAVLQLPEAGNAIAVSIDGNGRRVACDPYAGTIEAVLECAQNLACVGAEPLGLTNCLNFGNPEKPAGGLAARPRRQRPRRRLQRPRRPGRRRQRLPLQRGARRPDLPDAGGGDGRRAARPGAGRRHRLRQRGRRDRPDRPLRTEPRRLGAGEAAGRADDGPPPPDIASVAAACAAVRDAVRAGRLSSVHDVSDGGLAVALAESRDRRRPRLPSRPRSTCASAAAPPRRPSSARAPAASWSAASARDARGPRRRPARRGRRRGDRDRRRRPQPLGQPRRRQQRHGTRCRTCSIN